jgi:hypothetical protein
MFLESCSGLPLERAIQFKKVPDGLILAFTYMLVETMRLSKRPDSRQAKQEEGRQRRSLSQEGGIPSDFKPQEQYALVVLKMAE